MKKPNEYPDLFNLSEGKRRADEGAKTASDHADSVIDGWSERAFKLLLEFLPSVEETFLSEDVRVWANRVKELPEPPDNRAWGHIMKKASKAGLISHKGFAPVRSKNSHSRPSVIWAVVR